ncbi:MAG TPA: DUF4160 domain-containing protein [Pirellulales bacterium]|nr:DUF4160 domain-containing protein [Pirellulales bacterium]
MPEVSRFYGIIIRIYYADHPPPHFHAAYGGNSAKIDIDSLHVIDGKLPARALGLIVEWATVHRAELLEAFRRAALSHQERSIRCRSIRAVRALRPQESATRLSVNRTIRGSPCRRARS